MTPARMAIAEFIINKLPGWYDQLHVCQVDPFKACWWIMFMYRHRDARMITVDRTFKRFHLGEATYPGLDLSEWPWLTTEQVVAILKEDKLRHMLEVL